MLDAVSKVADATAAIRLADIRNGREQWFPSEGSLEWHFRRHKVRYVREGAVMVIRGVVHVVPERFDEVFAAIALDEARAMVGIDDRLASPVVA